MLEKIWWKRSPDIDEKTLSVRVKEAQKKTVPSHVAIIMDGNGRWAKLRNLPRVAGHHEGMKTVRKVTRFASRLGINVLTLYAFSTENWKRPRFEVDFLMKLPGEFLNTYLPELIEENVRVEMIGDFTALPPHTRNAIHNAMEATAHNDGLILNFAMNYGSRLEMVNMVKEISELTRSGEILPENIDESLIESHLMTRGLPEPDLLIRTSGEIRLSNFMLWQLAYAEFIFTDVFWPDFDEECLIDAIEEFQMRSRRYGNVEEEVNVLKGK